MRALLTDQGAVAIQAGWEEEQEQLTRSVLGRWSSTLRKTLLSSGSWRRRQAQIELIGLREPAVAAYPRPEGACLFAKLAAEWKEDTRYVSSVSERVLHPAYQKIIGMGEEVLPLLFADLRDNDGDWFWALGAITREDPVDQEDWGNHRAMKSAWLMWAHHEGYLA